MVIKYQFRLRVLDSRNISNPLCAMREERPLRQRREPKKKDMEKQ